MEMHEIYKIVYAIREIAKADVDQTAIALADMILPKDFTIPEGELYELLNRVDSQLESIQQNQDPIICCSCGDIDWMKKNPVVGKLKLDSLKCPKCGEKGFKYIKIKGDLK